MSQTVKTTLYISRFLLYIHYIFPHPTKGQNDNNQHINTIINQKIIIYFTGNFFCPYMKTTFVLLCVNIR